MTNGIFTVAILGVGARGGNVYGKLMKKQPDKYKITHLCDMRKDRLEYYGELFSVPESQRYTNEDDIFAGRKADILVIGTQDNDHIRHAIRAFETGYDILVEKPLSDNEEECLKLLEAQKKSGCKALVCHVLRYAPAYRKLYEIVNSGILGKIVSINWTEPVAYWHQAHSYVRGNWRNTDIAAPMILAKCCHDLDLIQWFAKSKCRSVSSVGSLDFFKPECAPEGAAKRCTDCPHKSSCPYSAYKIYWEKWEKSGRPETGWPVSAVCQEPVKEKEFLNALENGPYGRCVFYCDNNVVDHQTVQMLFENGITATLHMTAFTATGGRRVTLFGTYGEVSMYDKEKIVVSVFGKPDEVIDVSTLTIDSSYGHGGGDYMLINTLYDMLMGNSAMETSLEASIESHLMGIKAEESRLAGGELKLVHR